MAHGWEFLTPEDRQTILDGIRTARARGGPYHLELDWTDRCNVNCFFCNNRARNQAGQELPFEVIQRTLDEAVPRGLKSLRLAGGGEPLFHAQIRPLLEDIGRRGLVIENLTTNGVLIDPDMARRLAALQCREIIVSLNYPDPQSYARHMQTSERNWGRVVRALDLLRGEREASGRPDFPRLLLQFLVSDSVKFDIPRMVEIGNAHGVDFIGLGDLYGVEPSHRIPEDDKERVKDDLRRVVLDDPVRILPDFQNEGLDEFCGHVMREVWARQGKPTEPPPPADNEYCYIGQYSLTIRGNGDVFPCCMMMVDETAAPLGNLHQTGLVEIWNGPQCRQFRREMERVQILEPGLDFGRQRFRRIYPACATRYGCSMARTLCDAEFFREAEALLRVKRRRPRSLFLRLRSRS